MIVSSHVGRSVKESFVDRQIVGSYEVAKETAIILRQVVSTTRWSDASVLVQIITDLGRRLVAAQPKGKTLETYEISQLQCTYPISTQSLLLETSFDEY
jgi:translation initiation factor 2B subunit (eIF-2B alpha/beta/delta family)